MKTIRNLSALALFVAPLLAPWQAAAQQQDETVYTYVAEFRVAAAKRSDFVFQFNQYAKPVLDRLLADGTLTEWGRAGAAVHTENGMTDTIWWCATKASGDLKVLEEVAKANMPPSVAEAHSDTMLESLVFKTRKNTATGGYVYLTNWNLQTGKAEAWMDAFNKYYKPILEKLLAGGDILGYGVDYEYVHTSDPRMRSMWIQTEDAASADKVDAGFAAAREAMSPQDRRAMLDSMTEILAPDSHRDYLLRVVEYRHK